MKISDYPSTSYPSCKNDQFSPFILLDVFWIQLMPSLTKHSICCGGFFPEKTPRWTFLFLTWDGNCCALSSEWIQYVHCNEIPLMDLVLAARSFPHQETNFSFIALIVICTEKLRQKNFRLLKNFVITTNFIKSY